MAEAIFRQRVVAAGLSGEIEVRSAGTEDWNVGMPAHRGTLDVLRRHGIPHGGRAREVSRSDLDWADYVVAMDASNVSDLRRLDRRGDLDGKLYRLMEFGPPNAPMDVPDPYYDGRFDYVYGLVEAGVTNLLDHIRNENGL
jgi:protein-tyrosine phosphatase